MHSTYTAFMLLAYILFLLLCPKLFGQQVTIDNKVFEKVRKSLLVFSRDDGLIEYEKILYAADFEQDFRGIYPYKKDKPEKPLNFTILNEYCSNNLGKGYCYFRAFTYYHVADSLNVSRTIELEPKQWDATQPILIWVDGVESVQYVDINPKYSSDRYEYKKHRKRLKIQATHLPDNDLFFIIQCNGEEKPRYLYIPPQAIQPDMTFFYEDLSDDLTYISVALPEKSKWNIYVYAQNTATQKRCTFYQTKQYDYLEQIGFWVPNLFQFRDFNFSARSLFSGKSRTIGVGLDSLDKSADLLVPSNDFQYPFSSLENGFSMGRDTIFDKFRTAYYACAQKLSNSPSSYIPPTTSLWYVEGETSPGASFIFPKPSLAARQQLRSLTSWCLKFYSIQAIKQLAGAQKMYIKEFYR